MVSTLVNKIYEMGVPQRTFLFGSVKFFQAQLDMKRHNDCDLSEYCRLSRLEIMDQYKLNSREMSQVYKFVKEHQNDGNIYKSFRDEYLINVK